MKVVFACLFSIVLAAFILPDKKPAGLSLFNAAKAITYVQPGIEPTPITVLENLLTGKTWQVMEVNDLSNCHNTHYLRGGSENTGADYDPLKFTFRKNHTGVHTDTENNTYTFDWKFSDAQTLEIIVRAYSPVRYVWRMVEVSENKLTATTPINLRGGKDVLVTATYAPVNTKQIPFDKDDRTALLTAQTWVVDEVYNNAGCSNVVYRRNETESTEATIPFQQLRLQFHADGTGLHRDTEGNEWNFTWEFTSIDQRSLRIDVAGGRAVYNWNQVELKDGVLYQTCVHQADGKDVLVSAKWISEESCETSVE